jgi:hypothetical protein
VCTWTSRLPRDQRDVADGKLVAAAVAGMCLQDLAGLFGVSIPRAGQPRLRLPMLRDPLRGSCPSSSASRT